MILAMYALPVSTPRVKSTERIGPHCSAVFSILIKTWAINQYNIYIRDIQPFLDKYKFLFLMEGSLSIDQDRVSNGLSSGAVAYPHSSNVGCEASLVNIIFPIPFILKTSSHELRYDNLSRSCSKLITQSPLVAELSNSSSGSVTNTLNDRKKKIFLPDDIETLTPATLASLIGEHGFFEKKGKRVIIGTDSPLDKINILLAVLRNKFSLNSYVLKFGKKGYVIAIAARSIPLLQSILDPFMPKEMRHKIKLK